MDGIIVDVKNVEMHNNILKLETGQKLRILSLYPSMLFDAKMLYYDNHLNKTFITNEKIDTIKHKHLTRMLKYYALVEYKGELKLIIFGRKIEQKLEELVEDGDLKYGDFLNHYITLVVVIEDISGFPNFDKCEFYIEQNYPIDDYFNSAEYLDIINKYEHHIKTINLKNNNFLIEYLYTLNILTDKNPLVRLLKFKKLMK